MYKPLFIIAKTWKQQKCSSIGKWINKLWYIQTMEYYSVLERNELSSHEKRRKNLKCILVDEIIQSEKATYMTFWKRQNYGDSKKNSVAVRSLGGWKGVMNRQSTEDFEGSETVPYDTAMVNTCHYTLIKTHSIHNTE